MIRRQQARHAALLALGVALLANSRPFEGMVAGLPAGLLVLAYLLGHHAPPWRATFGRILMPILAVLGLTAAGMMYFNRQVTGHPLQLPYQTNEAAYAVAPLFLWQSLKPEPVYR